MNINKAIVGTLAVAGLAITLVAGAQAQETIANVASKGTQDNTQFTSSAGGDKLVVTYNDGVFSQKSGAPTLLGTVINFTATGGSTINLGGGNFFESFTGGSFSAVNSGVDLLSGTFTGGKILGSAGDLTGAFGATGVTYDTSSTALPVGDSRFNGLITLTFNPINGGYVLSPGGALNSFTATDAAIYSAVPGTPSVPEPATVVPFLLGGFGLLGLIVRKTRRTNGAAA